MSTRTRSVAILAANPAFAAILSRALEQDGYRVASFVSVDALTAFLRSSPVDAVVLDCDLPGAPAVDIAHGLRTHVRLSDIDVVALTRAASAFHKPLLAAGIDAVLQKPVVPGQLIATLDRLLADEREVLVAAAGNGAKPLSFAPPPQVREGNVIPLFGEGRQPR